MGNAFTDKVLDLLGLVRDPPTHPNNGPRYQEWKPAPPPSPESIAEAKFHAAAHAEAMDKIRRVMAKHQLPTRKTVITKTPLDLVSKSVTMSIPTAAAPSGVSNTTTIEVK